MAEIPKCEHCGRPLDTVYVKTSVIYTYLKDMGEYLNTEKNWDYEGELWAECHGCRKITESVAFTEDGRLIPSNEGASEK